MLTTVDALSPLRAMYSTWRGLIFTPPAELCVSALIVIGWHVVGALRMPTSEYNAHSHSTVEEYCRGANAYAVCVAG